MIAATPPARAWLRGVVREAGPVVVVLARRHAPGPLCFGAADYVPGPHDVIAGEVEGCRVYTDRRDALPDRCLLHVAAGSLVSWTSPAPGTNASVAQLVPLGH